MNQRKGLKEAIEYLYLNFNIEELLDSRTHIVISVIADVYGKDVDHIKQEIQKLSETKLS